MQIRRREFVVAAVSAAPALVVIGLPTFAALPAPGSSVGAEIRPAGSRFAIAGWNASSNAGSDQVLIHLSSSWRAAWH
jgi:hypothetical protein